MHFCSFDIDMEDNHRTIGREEMQKKGLRKRELEEKKALFDLSLPFIFTFSFLFPYSQFSFVLFFFHSPKNSFNYYSLSLLFFFLLIFHFLLHSSLSSSVVNLNLSHNVRIPNHSSLGCQKSVITLYDEPRKALSFRKDTVHCEV